MGEPTGEEDPSQRSQRPPEAPCELLRPDGSPFVSRLRMEVASSRTTVSPARQWELQPSIGSWLTPRGRGRAAGHAADAGSGCSAAEGHGDSGAAALPALDSGARQPQEERQEEAPPPPIEKKLELRIKGSAAKPFTLQDVPASATVAQLKALCQPHVGLLPAQQQMLHKGKLLQESQTLEEAKIPTNGTVFLVKAAQKKTEGEEAPKAAPPVSQGPAGPPCAECGVNVGRAQTNGLCSICWREQVVRENKEMKKRREQARQREEAAVKEAEEKRRREEELELRRQQDTSRCYTCRKKIGLTGFLCQCGYHYCATHRHAEEHACTFDHRARGRDLLAQQTGAARSPPSGEAARR